MLVIRKTCEEMKELLYEAKERACMAIEYKSDYPMLASTLIDIANSGIAQVEKLHNAVMELINSLKSKETVPESMLELWNFEHKIYLEMYEKAKIKIAMYNKM